MLGVRRRKTEGLASDDQKLTYVEAYDRLLRRNGSTPTGGGADRIMVGVGDHQVRLRKLSYILAVESLYSSTTSAPATSPLLSAHRARASDA